MSWISKNYEKAALGGTAVVAIGLVFFGWSRFGSVEKDFGDTPRGRGKEKTAIAGADQIPRSRQQLQSDRTWDASVIPGGRPVDLFRGVPLFVSRENPEKALDPYSGPEIHEGIPNSWWLKNYIDPGFADSPSRDPDGDGFTNLEEFQAKTDPNSDKEVPAVIAKLMYVKDESLMWVLQPRYGSEGKFPFKYRDSDKQENKVRPSKMVGPGDLFFATDPMAKRFKFLGSEERTEMNEKVNIEMKVTYVRIEDQRPNKKGKIYELPAPLSDQRANEHLQYDRTAVLSLEALGLSGTEFKVEENTRFALPPTAETKDYLLKSVEPKSIVVEYTDASGERKTVKINKGMLPDLSE